MPHSPSPVAPEDPSDLLAQVAFLVMAELTRLAAELDMSLTQLRVLGILRDRTPRMAELADFLGLEKSTVSGLITRSERRGLVKRASSAGDARATDIVMTPAGHVLAHQVAVQLRVALGPLTDRLSADERDLLAGLLAKTVGSGSAAGS